MERWNKRIEEEGLSWSRIHKLSFVFLISVLMGLSTIIQT